MNGRHLRLIGMCVALASVVALADWGVPTATVQTDGHVMHFPQMPTGSYDVMVDVGKIVPMLADDWRASTSGSVTDAHLWYSWNGDIAGEISYVLLDIYTESQTTPGMPGESAAWQSGPLYALGDNPQDPGVADYSVREWTRNGPSSQWYDPFGITSPTAARSHDDIYQLNVNNLLGTNDDYFQQTAGEVYWLAVTAFVDEVEVGQYQPALGWHTSNDSFGQGALWNNGGTWTVVEPAGTGSSVDMAFVMTPEPGALGLLLLGGASLAVGRRRRIGTAAG